jgi:hypothetical protein
LEDDLEALLEESGVQTQRSPAAAGGAGPEQPASQGAAPSQRPEGTPARRSELSNALELDLERIMDEDEDEDM